MKSIAMVNVHIVICSVILMSTLLHCEASQNPTKEFDLKSFLKKILRTAPIFKTVSNLPPIGSVNVKADSAFQDDCKDQASWCPQYAEYCNGHAAVKNFCKETCGICTVKTTCTDTHPNCNSGVEWGYCNGNERELSFMKQFCPKACKFCGDPVKKTCKDQQSSSYCKQIKDLGYCTRKQYRPDLIRYCKKTCNFCEECGIAKMRELRKTEIVGGENAHKGFYPWQVAIYYKDEFVCGGSLISANEVVTAAHCFNHRETNTDSFRVVLGEHNRQFDEGTEQTASVANIIMHENYVLTKDHHDIAIVKLTENAKTSRYISKICLPEVNIKLETGTKCFLTGWGKRSHVGSPVDLLQEVQIPIANRKVCETRNKFNFHEVTDRMICGGYDDGSNFQSGCHGDSGGPLQCEQNGKWFLYGVVSWGSPLCNGLDRYTVFTRVSSYTKWIERNRS